MKCPICQTEMWIKRSMYQVEGDNSPDTITSVYVQPVLYCPNKRCKNNNLEVVEKSERGKVYVQEKA